MISVGIDIGRASVKVAEAETAARGVIIKRFVEYPLSLDPNKDKKIEVIDILRNLVPQYNVEHTRFVFCVRQEDVSLRLKRFPFRERHKILRAVPFEVEDEIPFSPSDAIFEAKIIRFEGKMADVLAMACPKERVREVIQTAYDSGTHPSVLSLETAGLSNFLESWDQPPPEIAPSPISSEMAPETNGELLLDIGHASTKCLFYQNGALVAVRQIDWGGYNIVAQIATKYGLSALQATKELETKSVITLDRSAATKEQVAFSKVIETAVLDLVSELRLKILEIKADNHLNIVKGHMTGGPTMMMGLGGFLTQQLEIPFNRFKLFSLLPSILFEADERTESIAGCAIGLAIEGLKRPRNPPVNFLKEDFAKQSQTFERFWEKWNYTLKLAAAAFVLFFVYAFIRDSLSSSAAAASEDALKSEAAAVANLKGSAASPSKVRKFLAEYDKAQKARKQAEKVLKINSALDVLNLVSQNLPDHGIQLDVKHFVVDGDSAEIHGYLLGGTPIRDVQTALQAATADGKVEPITPQVPMQAGKQTFAFKFKVARTDGGE